MSNIAVLIETADQRVKETNFGVITAAHRAQADELYALVLGTGGDNVKEAVQNYGVSKVVEVAAQATDLAGKPDLQARVLAEALRHFNIEALLAVSTPQTADVLARLAAFMDVALVLDCVQVDLSSATVVKSHFSGRTRAAIKLNTRPFICGIRPNTIEAHSAAREAEVLSYQAAAWDPGRLQVVGTRPGDSRSVDLTEANIIITGGRPIGSAENFKILRECAEALGAAVGASRAAVDAGFAPHSMQVGQTGKTVSAKLYIGCGLSGSVQHFAGMKTSKVIVAINTDKDAPIFSKCDYGIIGDVLEVVPALTAEIKKQKSGS